MRARSLPIALLLAGAIAVGGGQQAGAQAAAVDLSIITFNVIGLDSNDVTVGPNVYPVGVRTCAASATAGVSLHFVWESENPYLALEGPATVSVGTLGSGECRDVYWNVIVTRDAGAYETSRRFRVDAVFDGVILASTPTPRELFVERLLSQERNSVNTITGPTAVTVGDVVTYVVDANTAPNGYEQLEAFLTLPSSIFELISVSVQYSAPPGATNDTVYADACGWDDDPTSPTYRTCIGPAEFEGGKAGGDLLTEYRVRVIGAGTATLTSAIYDKSGASYHYNADFGRAPNLITVTASAAPAPPAPPPASPPPTSPPPASSPNVTPVAAIPGATRVEAAPTTRAPAARTLANTGRGTVPLTGLGTLILFVGAAMVVLSRPAVALPAVRSGRDELRLALLRHEGDPAASRAADLMAALDRVHDALGGR